MSLLLDDDSAIGKKNGWSASFALDDTCSYYLYVVLKVDEDELDLSELGDVDFVLSEEPFAPSSGYMAVLLAEACAGKAWLVNIVEKIDDLLSPGRTGCFCKHRVVMNVDFISPKRSRRFRWSTRAEAGDIWKQYSASAFAKATSAPGQALQQDITAGYHERLQVSGHDIGSPIPKSVSEKSRHAKFLHTFESSVVQQILNVVLMSATHGVELNWKREVVPSSGYEVCAIM